MFRLENNAVRGIPCLENNMLKCQFLTDKASRVKFVYIVLEIQHYVFPLPTRGKIMAFYLLSFFNSIYNSNVMLYKCTCMAIHGSQHQRADA